MGQAQEVRSALEHRSCHLPRCAAGRGNGCHTLTSASLACALLISQPRLHKGFEIKPIRECASARKLEMTVN